MWKKIFLACAIFHLVLVLASPFAMAQNETEPESPFERLDRMTDRFGDILVGVLQSVKKLLIKVARAAYSVMGIAGILLWATRIQRRWGHELLMGAIMLGFIVECVIPCI